LTRIDCRRTMAFSSCCVVKFGSWSQRPSFAFCERDNNTALTARANLYAEVVRWVRAWLMTRDAMVAA
jgi:hypothetical protein